MKTALIKKMAQFIWNKQLSLISGPWHSIVWGILGRVLRTYYLTCPGQVFVPPLLVVIHFFHKRVIFFNILPEHSILMSTLFMALKQQSVDTKENHQNQCEKICQWTYLDLKQWWFLFSKHFRRSIALLIDKIMVWSRPNLRSPTWRVWDQLPPQ